MSMLQPKIKESKTFEQQHTLNFTDQQKSILENVWYDSDILSYVIQNNCTSNEIMNIFDLLREHEEKDLIAYIKRTPLNNKDTTINDIYNSEKSNGIYNNRKAIYEMKMKAKQAEILMNDYFDIEKYEQEYNMLWLPNTYELSKWFTNNFSPKEKHLKTNIEINNRDMLSNIMEKFYLTNWEVWSQWLLMDMYEKKKNETNSLVKLWVTISDKEISITFNNSKVLRLTLKTDIERCLAYNILQQLASITGEDINTFSQTKKSAFVLDADF